jgi:hypothetical protein
MFTDDVYVTLLPDFLHYDSEARFMDPTLMHSIKDDFVKNKASKKCKKTVCAHTELILFVI